MILIKADAYGHSQVEVARCLEKHRLANRLEGFGVANLEEAIALRRAKLKKPIYVMSGIQDFDDQIYRCLRDCDLVPVISSLEVLRKMLRIEKKISPKASSNLRFHLKFNTGMNRLGIEESQAEEAFRLVSRMQHFSLTGLLSHFSMGEKPKDSLTKSQVSRFRKIEAIFDSLKPKWKHMENSHALENKVYPEGNLKRVGLHLYGLGASPLKPVAAWRTQVYQVRTLQKGQAVGYGARFKAIKTMRMAVLGVGYADGYRRSFSHQGYVLLGGKKCKIIGSVSMDLTAVDISKCPEVKPGDTAVLIGKQGNHAISADDLANFSNTISYEIMTGISSRVPRVFYGK